MRVILVALVLLVVPTTAALPAWTTTTAVGPVTYDYVTTDEGVWRTCAADGVAHVTIDVVLRRIAVAVVAAPCTPASTVTPSCRDEADGAVVCERDAGATHIHARLGADGAFTFLYEDATFTESMSGVLVRA